MNLSPLFIVLFLFISISNGYKILFLVPFPGPSHWILLQNFAKELVNRGHEVTAVVNTPITNFKSPNYTEILIDPPFDLSTVFSMDDAYAESDNSYFEKVTSYEMLCTPTSDHGLSVSNVQQLIHSKNQHFDLVINEDMFHEAWLMFAHKFNAPIITICTYGYSDFFDRAMGLMTPLSHVPHMLLPYGDDMTYFERAHNVILSIFDWGFRTFVTLPKQNAIAQKYFGHLAEPGKPLPSVEELYRSISMIFVNTHKSTSKPRPQMPGIVHVGGAHIKSPKALPPNLQSYIDNSEHGVIFFSLGSFLQSSKMPREKIDILLSAFGKLKQRIIWKFEDETYKVPPNVLVSKWLPQSDILAHPNVILFITHGGMSGTFEGIARGVPMLFIPIFGDQLRNSLKTVSTGNALMLAFSELSVESLSAKINELLNNKVYYNRAKALARNFNDNLVHPMDEAMFYIEYVIRSKGAEHLKSKAAHMSLVTYLLLDILIVPFIAIAIVYFTVKSIFARKANKNQTAKSDKKKKKN